ncbi:hypothetical protein [Stenomitos frigidus]|uniref:Uncharacterized protein n=1 Tax=Stenomitos frigidus ULC18 TaxID=2107698 RepID=A0A2T1E5U7_9CYAN|nr:hypothetical protein [Stenomitos frigidus]PSB28065.1 hypothetical protein C7B82_14535 [Stenomitos frigidus ULC18]
MTKQRIFSTLARRSHVLSAGLAVTAMILSQYNPPPPKTPPGRQTSFTTSAQDIAKVPQLHVLFES